jgi:hypothetical protein
VDRCVDDHCSVIDARHSLATGGATWEEGEDTARVPYRLEVGGGRYPHRAGCFFVGPRVRDGEKVVIDARFVARLKRC